MLKAIGKFALGIIGIGIGLFVAVGAVGLAGDGMGDILAGGSPSAPPESKDSGFRKSGN